MVGVGSVVVVVVLVLVEDMVSVAVGFVSVLMLDVVGDAVGVVNVVWLAKLCIRFCKLNCGEVNPGLADAGGVTFKRKVEDSEWYVSFNYIYEYYSECLESTNHYALCVKTNSNNNKFMKGDWICHKCVLTAPVVIGRAICGLMNKGHCDRQQWQMDVDLTPAPASSCSTHRK